MTLHGTFTEVIKLHGTITLSLCLLFIALTHRCVSLYAVDLEEDRKVPGVMGVFCGWGMLVSCKGLLLFTFSIVVMRTL